MRMISETDVGFGWVGANKDEECDNNTVGQLGQIWPKELGYERG